MEKLKQYGLYLTIPAIILIAFMIGNYRSQKEATTFSCKFNEITLETVRDLPGGSEFNAETVRQVNEETPYCSVLCKEELNNARQYPNEWWTSEENRELCKKAGVILPE